MFDLFKRGFPSLALLLSGAGFFLSCWIVIPAPTYFLLVLGVAAPELSPWLLVWNAIAFLCVFSIRRSWWQYLFLGFSLTGILLCGLPLVQLPATEHEMAVEMERASVGLEQEKMRSRPFILADVFRGIDSGKPRYKHNITFTTPDGKPLGMDIYQPPQIGKYPALVTIYGGGWQNGSPAENAEFNRYMAVRGYTVFAIDYRHAPQHRFPAQLDDVRAALAFIRQHADQYEADSDRMALLGRSSGAHLAMLAAYHPDAPPIRAVVDYYGPVNLTEGYTDPPRPDPLNVRALLEAFLGGSPTQVPAQYINGSPINYVTEGLPPTLLVYGRRDRVVQVRFGRQMRDRLRQNGNTAVFLEIPWAEHSFDLIFNSVSNQLALYYTERFLAWALQENLIP